MDRLKCPHSSKTKKLLFSCHVTGNYELDLCDDCYKKENKQFLIAEEDIIVSKSSSSNNQRCK